MKTRDAVLTYQKTEKDSDVDTIDLNFKDPISAINLEVECVNGATSNLDNWISDIVTKIEVVDGSNVLGALNQFGLEAMQFFKTRNPPAIFPTEHANGIQRHNATLFFGRHLWDTNYALDPQAYSNPQLKITYNKAAIRAASATGFAAGDNIKQTVVVKLMEGQTAPSQYLMQKQIDSFTSVANGEKRIDLPRDYEYRMLVLRAYKQASAIDTIISDVKLTCDTDGYILLNRKTKQLDAEALAQFGLSTLKHDVFAANGAAVRGLHNKEVIIAAHGFGVTAGIVVGVKTADPNEMKFDLNVGHDAAADVTGLEALAGSAKLTCNVTGHALHATLPIVFGVYDDPGTWFSPKPYGKFEAVLTQTTAGATIEIIAEQIRPQSKL